MIVHAVGVDPGLVHTGCVRLWLDDEKKVVEVRHHLVDGLDSTEVSSWALQTLKLPPPHIYIEAYRPRSNFSQDTRMIAGVQEMKQAMPGSKVVNNTGVKQVIRRELMELLGVWKYSTVSHHQDLRSAARIMLYGMLKDDELNRHIADVVKDHVDMKTWQVRT